MRRAVSCLSKVIKKPSLKLLGQPVHNTILFYMVLNSQWDLNVWVCSISGLEAVTDFTCVSTFMSWEGEKILLIQNKSSHLIWDWPVPNQNIARSVPNIWGHSGKLKQLSTYTLYEIPHEMFPNICILEDLPIDSFLLFHPGSYFHNCWALTIGSQPVSPAPICLHYGTYYVLLSYQSSKLLLQWYHSPTWNPFMTLHCLWNPPEFPHTSTHGMPPHLLLYPNFLLLPGFYVPFPPANRTLVPQKRHAPSLSIRLCSCCSHCWECGITLQSFFSFLSNSTSPWTFFFFHSGSQPDGVFLLRIFTVLWRCLMVIDLCVLVIYTIFVSLHLKIASLWFAEPKTLFKNGWPIRICCFELNPAVFEVSFSDQALGYKH